MGIRTQCAQCHNHPFDRWTMDDYYSFAAFFSQIGRKQSEDYREIIVFNSGGGEVAHPVGGRADEAEVPGRRRARRGRQGPPRSARQVAHLAPTTPTSPPAWPTASGPTSSARASSSRSTTSASATPPATPSCSSELGDKLVEYKYDFKQLVRDICNSQAYQRSTERNESNMTDERNFAHGNVRRIPAEMLLDCISQVTGAQRQVRRPAAGFAGRADRRRRHQQLLPDDLRPRPARHGLRLRGQDRADAVAGPAHAQRQHDPGQDPAGRPDRRSCSTRARRRSK